MRAFGTVTIHCVQWALTSNWHISLNLEILNQTGARAHWALSTYSLLNASNKCDSKIFYKILFLYLLKN